MQLVHAYPLYAQLDRILQSLAEQNAEPTQRQILAASHSVDTTEDSNDLMNYIRSIKKSEWPVYVPMLRQQPRLLSHDHEKGQVMQ